MSKLESLEKLIKLYGDEQKYSEGMSILNPGVATPTNGKLAAFVMGAGLIVSAVMLNPKLITQAQDALSKFQGSEAVETVNPDEPPQPPEIERPTPPEVPQQIYYQYQAPGQSLVYRPGSY